MAKQLEKSQWRSYFDRMSKALVGKKLSDAHTGLLFSRLGYHAFFYQVYFLFYFLGFPRLYSFKVILAQPRAFFCINIQKYFVANKLFDGYINI